MDVLYDPCAGVVVAVDSDDPAQLEAVDAAVALWNDFRPLRLTREEVSDFPRLRISFEGAAAAFRGVYDDERGVVVVNRDLPNAHVRTITVAHELGHAFGLWHTASGDGASVMKADNVDVAPTPGDVARLQSIWQSCTVGE